MENASVDVGVFHVRKYDIQLLEQMNGEFRAEPPTSVFAQYEPESPAKVATQSACRLDEIMEQLEN